MEATNTVYIDLREVLRTVFIKVLLAFEKYVSLKTLAVLCKGAKIPFFPF